MLVRVAAVLLFLQCAYLLAGNLLVRSRLIKQAVESADGFHLDYASAYTLWPGHVRVHDLSLRFEDYNVQFEVALAQADLHIALSELPFKKFRVTELSAEGTRFRMRHKLIVVGADAERVAAYPPIRGFADPPYYVGVRSPPIPDEEYDLWQVRIQDVTAHVSELWIQEYRFLGQGVARGSFVVRPARWVQVEPAELVLERGTLTLGEHLVAGDVRGRIQCSLPDMHVQAVDGLEVFREISGNVRLELDRGRLDFVRVYLERLADLTYSGAADWRLNLDLERGVVQPGSRLSLKALPLRLRRGALTLDGDVSASFERSATEAIPELRLSWLASRLEARRGGSRDDAPSFEGVSGELRLNGVELDQPISLGESRLALARGSFPSLGWLRPTAPGQLRGSGTVSASLARTEAGLVTGQAKVAVTDARLQRGGLSASGDLSGELALTRAKPNSPLLLNKLYLSAERASLRSGEKLSEPFSARLDASGLSVALEPAVAATGTLRLYVSSTEAVLPLLVSRTVQNVGDALLDLRELRASARVKIESGGIDVTGLDARDGQLRLRGHVSKHGGAPRGALLVSSGPLNIGVTLQQGTTAFSPFVGDDWLARSAQD